MTMRRAIAAWFILTLAAACGGSTESSGSGGSGGSAGNAGNAGTGGSSGSAGTGGSAGIGGASGTGASGGVGGAGGSGATTGFDDCTGPGQCTLFASNCCGGYCSPVPLSSFVPINASKYTAVQAELCDDLVACPDCITALQPNYIAACRSNTCVAVDVRADALSACNTSADCRLRWGSSCCESCASFSEELIALKNDASLEEVVCDPLAGACPPCAPQPYPSEAKAECIAGHCQVTWEAQPGV
jgi:hypothetical protein